MTTFTTVVEARNLAWQTPESAYHNMASTPNWDRSAMNTSATMPHKIITSGPTIREIRESLPASAVSSRAPSSQMRMHKKKSSLFAGLFAKEPSMVALEQFTANMAAHRGGSVTAKTVPHASSQKMPTHVPKVNSKWDGVPDAVRDQAKARQKANRTSLTVSGIAGLKITGLGDSGRSSARRNSNADTCDSRSIGPRPEFEDHGYSRPDSIYSTSSGLSGERASAPVEPRSLRSPSTASLPEITAFFPNGTASYPTNPSLDVQSKSSIQTSIFSTDERQSTVSSMAVDSIPEHTSSPIPSPMEQSPQTPLPYLTHNTTPKATFINPITKKHQPIDAFLAGEAQPLSLPDEVENQGYPDVSFRSRTVPKQPPPIARLQQGLEKRPDSSRARLGLRASMVVGTESVPWEMRQNYVTPRSPTSPRGVTRIFGR